MQIVRPYLRASTEEQDASRAEGKLKEFIAKHGMKVASWYRENASGARLDRPELQRLLSEAEKGDVLLVESIDRLGRLTQEDWKRLSAAVETTGLNLVVLDIPTTHTPLAEGMDKNAAWMMKIISNLIVEIGANAARSVYELQKERQSQGIKKAKGLGKYKGRPEDKELLAKIERLLRAGYSWSQVQKDAANRGKKVSRSTVAKVAARMRDTEKAAGA